MADLVKVKTGLECCAIGAECDHCPYSQINEGKGDYTGCHQLHWDALELLKEQSWVKCSDRMPEEHDSIFAKLKGTDKWQSSMFEKLSDDVRIVEVFGNGTRRVYHSHTIDGKWDIENQPMKRTVTHWMPNPELPLEGRCH